MWIIYQQPVNIVQNQLHMLWRTNDLLQNVDKKCGYVDKVCGYLVCKLFVIGLLRGVNCEYLDCDGRKAKGKILETRH